MIDSDVVDHLLALEDGATVSLEAQDYRWSSPFDVDVLDDVEWDGATGDDWRSRSFRLDPEDSRAQSRDVHVVEGLPAPSIGSYGRLVDVSQEGFSEDVDVEWLSRPADEVVDASEVPRDLDEVLRSTEVAEGWFDVHQRIASPSTSTTKTLLWELGLREQSGRLLDEPELQERVDRLREVFVDDGG